jgi:hypothetical protein
MEQAKALLIEQHAKDAQLQANADTSLTQK